MKNYKIAAIAGDGIGKEVLPESLKIYQHLQEACMLGNQKKIFYPD